MVGQSANWGTQVPHPAADFLTATATREGSVQRAVVRSRDARGWSPGWMVTMPLRQVIVRYTVAGDARADDR